MASTAVARDWQGNESIAPRSASIGRIVGTLDRSQGGFVPANGVCDEAAAGGAVRIDGEQLRQAAESRPAAPPDSHGLPVV